MATSPRSLDTLNLKVNQEMKLQLKFATEHKNKCRPPPVIAEEGEKRSAVFCKVTGVHSMCQIFMNDLLTEQGQQRSRVIR